MNRSNRQSKRPRTSLGQMKDIRTRIRSWGDTWLCRGSTILKLGSAHNLDIIWRRHILLGTIRKLESKTFCIISNNPCLLLSNSFKSSTKIEYYDRHIKDVTSFILYLFCGFRYLRSKHTVFHVTDKTKENTIRNGGSIAL